MTPERWQRIEELFVRSVDLDEAARAGFLDDTCDNDDVRAAVEGMLRADGREHDELRDAVGDAAKAAAHEAGDRWRGRQLGSYRIEHQLAAGGMGSVFVAQRADDEFERKVAIKLLSSALTSEDGRRRFLIERQILANLAHPHIAQLLDGGTTDDGVPYLVMEYIDGAPIDEYCDRERLGIPERLRLFLKVCEAVQYAHRHLVVHRDLKPGNILVTADGTPKLLDFGIAKLLDATAANATEFLTVADARLLTPLHASPEQLRGHPVTTASDIYSLGVLLYQLLSGHSPYRGPTRTPVEIERAICETEPPLPSSAVARRGAEHDTPKGVSEARRGLSGRLGRQLAGDLDTIVMKALRKEPEERYATAGEFADDLRRHLEDRPIEARPAGRRYRLRKFAARHKAGVVAGTAVLLLVTALVTFHTVRLAEERDLQAQQRQTAERVSDFMVGLFENADPRRDEADVSAGALLEQGVEQIDELRQTEPLVAASLMVGMGRAHTGLAEHEQAVSLLGEALAVRRRHLAPDHPDVATALHYLGNAEAERAGYVTARELFDEALAIRESTFGPDALPAGETLYRLGFVHMRLGDYDAMQEVLERALRIHEQSLGPRAARTGLVATLLGSYHWVTGDYPAARELIARGLAISEEAHGPDSIRVVGPLHNLGLITWQLGDYPKAHELYERELAIREAHLDADHPDLALPMYGLAITSKEMGHYEEALAWYRRTVELQESVLGPNDHYLAMTLSGYGFTLLEVGDFETAGDALGRSLAMFEAKFGPAHVDLRAPLTGLAKVAIAEGRHADARSRLERSLAIVEAKLDPEHADVLRTVVSMGELYLAEGDYGAAREYFSRGLDGFENTVGLDHPYAAPALFGMAQVMRANGEYRQAEDRYRRALAVQEKQGYSDRRPAVARTLEGYAELLRRTGREAEAGEASSRAARIRERVAALAGGQPAR